MGQLSSLHTVLFGQITYSPAPNQAAHLGRSHATHRMTMNCARSNKLHSPDWTSQRRYYLANPGEISGLADMKSRWMLIDTLLPERIYHGYRLPS